MKNAIIIYQPLFGCNVIALVCPPNTPPRLSYVEERFLLWQNALHMQFVNTRRCGFRARQSHPSYTKYEGDRYLNCKLY